MPPADDDALPSGLGALVAGFVRRHAADYLASAAMLAGIAALIVWVPRQIGALVDGLVAGTLHGPALTRELLVLLGAGVVIYALRVGWRLRLYAAAYRMGVELRLRLYRRLSAQAPAFFQTRRTGELMALATNDIDAIELAAGEALLAGFDGTLTLVAVVAMMSLGVDWRLAAVALLPFPLMAAAFWVISRRVHDASRDALQRFGALNDQVQQTLAGVRTVRAMGLAGRESARFSGLAGDAARAARTEQAWEAAFSPAVGLTLATASAGALALGGWLVWHGDLTLGALTSFGLYLGQLVWPMFAAGWVLSLIERGRAAWGRLRPVLAEPLSVRDDGTVAAVPDAPVHARGLRFSYPGQPQPALDGIDFTLPPGGTLAVVGPTGAGKSTLLALLLRQWSPQAGTLHWGEVPWAALTLPSLRAATAWVPQEPMLFSMTVAQNIALARPDAPPQAIADVARLAALDDDIARLPQGGDTPVGERGVTLSGGQKQRLALARALLTDAPLLLLDDTLSAVDTRTEGRILAHLRALRARQPGRRTVIASHRLSAVVDADEILVLRHGRVAERGTHATLLAAGGWYAAQWRYQQLQAQVEGPDGAPPAPPPPGPER